MRRYGKLDILLWRVIRLDLYGTFLCCKLAIPEIIKAAAR